MIMIYFTKPNLYAKSLTLIIMLLVIFASIIAFVQTVPRSKAYPFFYDDIENSTSGWIATGLWHVTTYQSHSSTHSWAYNDESTHTYDTGEANSGTLQSPEIDLTSAEDATLKFWTRWEHESYDGNFDIMEVRVISSTGTATLQHWDSNDGPAASDWHEETFDLTPYVGDVVRIEFLFDTVDGLYNNFEGWYVDDIIVEGSLPGPPPPITDVNASDTPNDNGGSITLTWAQSTAYDFDHYNIYIATTMFNDVSGLTAEYSIFDIETTTHEVTTCNGVDIIDGTEYYLAVTAVDDDGLEDTAVVPAGPVTSEDNLIPPPIENIVAEDTPNDNGGSITLSWSATTVEDFDHYNIYIHTVTFSEITGLIPELTIDVITTTTIEVTTIGGEPIANYVDYYLAVTAVDHSGQEAVGVTCAGPVQALDNLAPEPISNVEAIDTPDDNGGSIRVSWSQSYAVDFSHYHVYVTDMMISSVEELTPELVVDEVDNTTIDITTYNNGELLINGAEYYVAVTAVDLVGNELVEDITCAGPVIPLDNLPPPPITNVEAYDTPDDNGGSITLTWDYCNVEDFDYYNIYMRTVDITDIEGLAPHEASPIEDQTVTEIEITTYNNKPLEVGVDYYFAVTAVDLSGHELTKANSYGPVQSIDNLIPPPVRDVQAYDKPEDYGGVITVTWTAITDVDDFDHYNIYVSTIAFTNVDEMTPEVSSIRDSWINTYDITTCGGVSLIDRTDYYVAVTAVDINDNEDKNVVCFGPVQCRNNLEPPVISDPTTDATNLAIRIEFVGDPCWRVELDMVNNTQVTTWEIRGKATVPSGTIREVHLWWRSHTTDWMPLEDLVTGEKVIIKDISSDGSWYYLCNSTEPLTLTDADEMDGQYRICAVAFDENWDWNSVEKEWPVEYIKKEPAITEDDDEMGDGVTPADAQEPGEVDKTSREARGDRGEEFPWWVIVMVIIIVIAIITPLIIMKRQRDRSELAGHEPKFLPSVQQPPPLPRQPRQLQVVTPPGEAYPRPYVPQPLSLASPPPAPPPSLPPSYYEAPTPPPSLPPAYIFDHEKPSYQPVQATIVEYPTTLREKIFQLPEEGEQKYLPPAPPTLQEVKEEKPIEIDAKMPQAPPKPEEEPVEEVKILCHLCSGEIEIDTTRPRPIKITCPHCGEEGMIE
jgi:hypothetical protein